MKVAVVGAGIAGLCAATHLSEKHDVVVLERRGAPGGKIVSQSLDGYLFEWGPSSFLSSSAELLDLVHDAGLEDALVRADPAASRRYVYWNGALHALPSRPLQALTTPLLSPGGRLRALSELFFRPTAFEGSESVAAFFTRHFGAQVTQRVVAPVLLGITGGNAEASDVDALFPNLRAMERSSGSILRAFAKRRGTSPPKMLSFGSRGMRALTDAMAQRLGDRLVCDAAVERIAPRQPSGWTLAAGSRTWDADAVFVAAPAYAAAALLDGFDAELAALLRQIDYAPMLVAGVAFRAQDLPHPLDGFGFLAARGQRVRILGALFTSALCAQQAPADAAYLRVFLGGADDPQAASLDDASARAIVLADLTTALGITAEPLAFHQAHWPQAIPQYALGHGALVERIRSRARAHGTLRVVGNAYRGVGLADTVRDALLSARAALP